MKMPESAERVVRHTPEAANRRIQNLTQCSIDYYRNHPDQIERRLKELDQEWDIERALEINASSLIFGGSLLGLIVSKKFLLLPLAVSGFLLQHASQGWCPPLGMFRRLGYRTTAEIEAERHALQNHSGKGTH